MKEGDTEDWVSGKILHFPKPICIHKQRREIERCSKAHGALSANRMDVESLISMCNSPLAGKRRPAEDLGEPTLRQSIKQRLPRMPEAIRMGLVWK
ncbi:hypothetical protein CEXT_305411 [Caerostris extrusa]|uniref:Uncharacterized protein n=1 Tax=Caerostris extrusa TaxID=172846 RepID=A0AAV4P8Q9_CAEEX|nr:hypothetical protein CEXT_305411 [Caerostris extrusa]